MLIGKNVTGFILMFIAGAFSSCYSQQASSNQANINPSDTDIVATNAVPVLVSRQFGFSEGPSVDKKGNVFFTDQNNDKIWKYSTDGKLTLFMEHTGRSNGLYIDKKGNLLSCADEHNELWSIDKKGKVTVLLKDVNGKKLNGPNDLWLHPNGNNIYFTDPYYQRAYWTRKKPDIEGQKVYLFSKNKMSAVPVIEDLVTPNGIVGSPDGQYLYIGDVGSRKTYKYTINKDGSVSNGQVLFNQGSDGMTLDSRGNIYVTGNGVTVYNPAGKKIKYIAVPERSTTNVAFSGKRRDKLFITAVAGVYILDMKVRGIE